jgi:hypothetical protein
MRIVTALVTSVAALGSVVGAVVGYQQIAPAARADAATAAESQQPSAQPRPTVRFKPCPEGFRLMDRACVRRIQRTVTVQGPGVVSGAGGAAPVLVAGSRRSRGPTETRHIETGDDHHGRGHDRDDDDGHRDWDDDGDHDDGDHDRNGGDDDGDDDGDHDRHGGDDDRDDDDDDRDDD